MTPLLALNSSDTLLGVLLYVVGLILSLIVVARLLTGTKSPATTMLWVVVIVAMPYFGVLFYYLLPHRIQLARLRRRRQKLQDHAPPAPSCADDDGDGGDGDGDGDPMLDFLRRIDRMSVTKCNQVELLASGPAFFDEVIERIDAARTFVHVEMYIFRPDATGKRVLDALTRAASRGVEVRLLFDHIGSWSLKQHHLRELIAAGAHAVSFMPLLWRRRPFNLNLRNHRKLIFVDGEIAFLGGRNVGDEYGFDRFGEAGTWFDIMLSVCGPAVTPLHDIFVEDWFNACDEKLFNKRYFPEPHSAALGTTALGIVASGPDRAGKSFRHVLFEMIGRARERIEISSPYLVPHAAIDAALTAAAIRGVRIRLHCNGPRAAEFVLYHAARSQYQRLLTRGVEVIESLDDYNHGKMYVVDDRYVLLGSGNLDMRSFELNFEVGTLVVDRELCARCADLFEERAARGRRVTKADLDVGRAGKLVDGVCRLFSPVL